MTIVLVENGVIDQRKGCEEPDILKRDVKFKRISLPNCSGSSVPAIVNGDLIGLE
jgi:hypothetical protein